MRKKLWILIAITALAAIGCSDPTADTPAADVDEAAVETTDSSDEGLRLVLAPETTIDFTGYKFTGSHDGGFKNFTGHVMLVGDDPTRSSVEVNIDATSIWSDNERLTGHLKSNDFFDVENFPAASFKSTAIAAAEEGGYTITGNLELHGITKSVSFPAEITSDANRVVASATFKIKRFEFDISFEGKKDDLIRDDVEIHLNLIAVRDAAETESSGG